MSGPGREKATPRFLRESPPAESETAVTASELVARLEDQARELGVLKERLGSTTAALSSEREQRERLEQQLSEAQTAQQQVDQAVAGRRRERSARRKLEEELVRAREEIEALRLEVDHAWTRLKDLQEEPPARESRWRRRRDLGVD
jgi:chromosome segregation ATPase